MKVKMCRQSGLPVLNENVEEYKNEWREKYDEVLNSYNKVTEMETIQSELQRVQSELEQKYKSIIEVELPKNSKQWKAFQKQYGYSVLVTTDRDHKETRLILLDQGL